MGIRDRLGDELFRRVAGPDGAKQRDRIHGTPGPRWFEPGSPITRVHGDASMYIGGIRAVLLQTMHPKAMTAVAEHSGYRGDMWGRLARTATFIAVTTFGTERHAEQTIAAVRRIHDGITGSMPDGEAYAANDPHLLMWVHVAEIDSFLRAHQEYGAHPLTPDECDEYVRQAGEVAARLGVVDPPQTRAELDQVLADFRPELRATDHAREAVAYLIRHPELAWVQRPAYWTLVAAAVGLMPGWTRVPLRLPILPVAERTVVRALGRLSTMTVRWAMAPIKEHTRRLDEQARATRPHADGAADE